MNNSLGLAYNLMNIISLYISFIKLQKKVFFPHFAVHRIFSNIKYDIFLVFKHRLGIFIYYYRFFGQAAFSKSLNKVSGNQISSCDF